VAWQNVDDAVCDGNATYVYSNAIEEECFLVPLATVPVGSRITNLEITPCASINTLSGTSHLQVGYKFGSAAIAYGGVYNLTNTTPADQPATNINPNKLLAAGTTLSVCAKDTDARGVRVSRLATKITHTPPVTTTASFGLDWTGTQSNTDITWSDLDPNNTGYRVEYSLNSGSTWLTLATFPGTAASLIGDPRTPQAGYAVAYRVITVSGVYESAPSTVDKGVKAPTNFTAVTIDGGVHFSWSDTDTTDTGHVIDKKSGITWILGVYSVPGGATTFYEAAGATEGEYRVRNIRDEAVDDTSVGSNIQRVVFAPSNFACVLGIGGPSGDGTKNSTDCTWTDNSSIEGGFKLQFTRDAGQQWFDGPTVDTDVTAYNNHEEAPNVGYALQYRVVATSGAFQSLPSNVEVGVVAPSNFSITNNPNGVATWTDNSADENGFLIYRESVTGVWNQIASDVSSPFQWTQPVQVLRYHVFSYRGNDKSVASNLDSP
jgi:hypothetical protein